MKNWYIALLLALVFMLFLHNIIYAQNNEEYDQVVFIIQKAYKHELVRYQKNKTREEIISSEPDNYAEYIQILPNTIRKYNPLLKSNCTFRLHFLDESLSESNSFNNLGEISDYLMTESLESSNPDSIRLIDILEYYSKTNDKTFFVIHFDTFYPEKHLLHEDSTSMKLPQQKGSSGILFYRQLVCEGKNYQDTRQCFQRFIYEYSLYERILPPPDIPPDTFSIEPSFGELLDQLNTSPSSALTYNDEQGRTVYAKPLTINDRNLGFFAIVPPITDNQNGMFKVKYNPFIVDSTQEATQSSESNITLQFKLYDKSGEEIDRHNDFIRANCTTNETIRLWDVDTTANQIVQDTKNASYILKTDSNMTFIVPIEFLKKNLYREIKFAINKQDKDKPDSILLFENKFPLIWNHDKSLIGKIIEHPLFITILGFLGAIFGYFLRAHIANSNKTEGSRERFLTRISKKLKKYKIKILGILQEKIQNEINNSDDNNLSKGA